MSLHYHECAACDEQLVCSCDSKSQRVLCPDCKELEKALKIAFGDSPKLERSEGHATKIH